MERFVRLEGALAKSSYDKDIHWQVFLLLFPQ